MIGWTYESNRNKVKEAQTALDDFYRQDTIDDLTAAKEAELNNFEERIKNWDDYLEMLQSRYEEYDRLQEQKLLKELLGVDSQEEVEEIIKTDMFDFTTYMDEHLTDFFDNQITAFGNFNSIFGEFLDEYKKNLETLNGLNTQEVDTISADNYLGKNSTTVPDVTKTVKIKKTDQSLYDIVLNDAELLSGKKASNIDANGYYDYAANLATAAKSGDISEAIYQAVLRDVKIVNDSEYEKYADKDRTDTLYSYSKLEAALKSNSSLSSQQITTALKTYQTAQTNAQNVASAIANANLQVDSETSQAAIQLSTYLPVQLSEQQATQLATQMEGNAAIQSLLSDSSNVLSDKIGETTTTVEKTNAAIDAVTTLISGYFKTKEEAEAAAKSYVSSSSGGGGGGGGNSNASTIAQMKANSAAWHGADSDTQKALADKNAELGASLGWTRDSSGTWYDSSGNKAYAEGIENGPVTYTGLAMLHGTPTSPEYVLNSDQAYNLLKYMSTKKPEFTSNANTSSGDNWNLSGDIILENCNDPAQFWNEVTKAMSNRFNVTKNRR